MFQSKPIHRKRIICLFTFSVFAFFLVGSCDHWSLPVIAANGGHSDTNSFNACFMVALVALPHYHSPTTTPQTHHVSISLPSHAALVHTGKIARVFFFPLHWLKCMPFVFWFAPVQSRGRIEQVEFECQLLCHLQTLTWRVGRRKVGLFFDRR